MNETWFRHLSRKLSGHGMMAYAWSVQDDRYEWTGDFCSVLGASLDQPRNNDEFHRLLNPQNVPERLAALHAAVRGSDVSPPLRYYMRRDDGTQIEVEESCELHVDPDGGKTVYGFIRILGAGLHHATRADIDNIVGLGMDMSSLHHGRIRLRRLIEEWRGTPVSETGSAGFLLVMGIDRFTMYNEAFGATFADEIIGLVGRRLREIGGAKAEVTRIDGDVFSVLFDAAHHSEMPIFARYIIGSLWDRPLQTSRGPLTLGLSLGGILLQRNMAMDNPSIITAAEMAMQKAKERGRACFVSYDEASHEAQDTRLTLKTAGDFMRALKEDRVRLAFQPVMDMGNNKVSFHESLIRMIDDGGRLQSAASFVPAIERLGMSRMIDQFAMKTALHELALFSDLHLSVNVSNQTLEDPEWLRNLVAALREQPSVAKRLIIEITETVAITNFAITLRTVRTLQELGCRVALDDFGAGYTAFLQLKSLDVDIVKIDKSFIRDIGEAQNKLFIRALQSLADGVQVKTVGEGAETMAEAKLLADDGVHYVQGYVYGFPQVERVWLPKEHAHRKIHSGHLLHGQTPEPAHFYGRGVLDGALG